MNTRKLDMDINTLRDRFVEKVDERFPKKWSKEERYISLVRQVSGLGECLQYRQGTINKCNQHDPLEHHFACIMLDLFVLSSLYQADLQKELEKVMDWLEHPDKK